MPILPELKEQYEDLTQQSDAARLGLWTFLATEVLFFGGLFLAYTVYRWAWSRGFAAASDETNVIFGTANTAILLTSSFTMALAVRRGEHGSKSVSLLSLTALLGVAFLVIKGFEYREDFHKHLLPGSPLFPIQSDERAARLFFYLYYAMTGVHALHLSIGIAVLIALVARKKTNSNQIELAGLYWHFVDVIWVFLYPLIYLVGRNGSWK